MLELLLLQRGDDEQHGIGTGDAGFVELHFVDDEILPQTRERNLLADARKVAEVALEKLFIGEHGDAIRARRFIQSGDGERVEIGGDHSRAGRRFFYFGDEPEPLGAVIEPRGESPEIFARERRGAEHVRLRQNACDLARFDFEDFLEAIRWHKSRGLSRPSATVTSGNCTA